MCPNLKCDDRSSFPFPEIVYVDPAAAISVILYQK